MDTIDLDKIKKSGDIPKEVLEVYTFLKTYMDYPERKTYEKNRETNWKAIGENKISTTEQEKEMRDVGQEPLPVNKLNKGVQGASAIVTDSKPTINFHPKGSGDLYVAELLKRAFDLVWDVNTGNDVTYDAVEESKIGGLAWFDVKHNPSKSIYGRCEFEEACPEDIYFDRGSRKADFSDTHLIKAKLRTKQYILDRYDIDEKELYFEAPKESDEENKSAGLTSGDNYADGPKENIPEGGKDYVQPANIWEIEAWMLRTEKQDWLIVTDENGDSKPVVMELNEGEDRENGIKRIEKEHGASSSYPWKRLVDKRIQRIIVGKKLIEEKENPHGYDGDGDPVIPLIGLKHWRTKTAFPACPTTFALPINQDKIKARMQYNWAVSNLVNSPIIEPAGMVKWDGNPGTAGSRVKVDASAPFIPQRLQSGSFDTAKLIEREQLADRDIDDQYDLHDVMRGKLPADEKVAFRAIWALQDMGGMMSKPFLRKLESSLVRLAKAIIAIILRTWPRERWERLLEPDEKHVWTPEGKLNLEDAEDEQERQQIAKQMEETARKWDQALEKIRPSDPDAEPAISLIDLDVKMAAGSSMPTNRMAKGQQVIEYVKAGIYDAEAALDYIDDPEKDKIVQRLKQREQQAMESAMMKQMRK